MNKCDHIRQQLLDLDVSMTIQDPALEQHLKQCSACAAYYEDLLSLQQQVDQLPEHDVSDDVFARTLAAVQQEANNNQPVNRKRINQQWASGLAASFVLVAVVGLLYDGTISEFQGDFGEVTVATEQAKPEASKETPWIDPEGEAVDDITVELVDIDEVNIERNRRVQSMNVAAPSESASVGETLKQLQGTEPGAFVTPEPATEAIPHLAAPPMPDLLRESPDMDMLTRTEPKLGAMIEEAESSQEAAWFEDKAKAAEKKKESKPDAVDLDESVISGNEFSSPISKDQIHVNRSLEELGVDRVGKVSPQVDSKRETEFRAQREEQAKLKADSMPADGLVSNNAPAPRRQSLDEANKGYLRKDNRQANLAGAGRDDEQDDVVTERIRVTGSRIKRSDVEMTEESAAVEQAPLSIRQRDAQTYLDQLANTEGLSFKAATGYWANTYIPGDSNMRWLQAQLAQSSSLELPAVRQNAQPFDAPSNSALALYVNSDRNSLEATGPTRMRLQVGLQAGKQKGGHRSALNLALVLDLGEQPVQDELKALLDALLKNKRSSDQVSVFFTGAGGGQLIQASDFRHGPIQVMLNNLFTKPVEVEQTHVSLEQSIQAATQWLKTQDDPNAVLGSSAVWLVSANSNALVTKPLEHAVHRHATEGITFSTLAMGDAFQRDPLERLALQGQGHSRVMTGVNDAERVIQAEMMAASRAVARALRLQIRLAEGVQLVDVLGSYSLDDAQAQQVREAEQSLDQRMAKNLGIQADRGEDEDGIQMVIPSFFAGDTHVVLLDVLVNHSGSRQAVPVVEVNAKYKDLIYLRNASSSKTLDLAMGSNQLSPLELNVMKNVLAHRFATTMKQAASLLHENKHDEAIQELSNMLRLLQAMRTQIPAWKEDREIMQDEQVIKQYAKLLTTQSSINPEQYQLIVTSMNVNSWRRLLTHSP